MHRTDIQSPSNRTGNRRDRYTDYWRREFKHQPYYDGRYSWDDLRPAYEYAYDKHAEDPSLDFDDVEDTLSAGWDEVKGKSRLAWNEAREIVRSGWHAIERKLPGDADGDLR